MNKGHILIVDDEKSILNSLGGILTDEGFQISQAQNGPQALDIIMKEAPDLAILDVWLPGIDGIELLQLARAICPDLEIIMMSGHGNIDTAVKATKLGAFDFIEKPLSLENIVQTVNQALSQQKTLRKGREASRLASANEEIVGQSPAIFELKKMIPILAQEHFLILIIGEEGTGKELIGRAIHHSSGKEDSSFLRLNCPGLTKETLMALCPTPAGTIFFDQIAALDQESQQELLTLLKIMRDRENPPKIIASSTKSLKKEVEITGFNYDLWQYLDQVVIKTLPLRERKQDIPFLVQYFISQFSHYLGVKPKQITKDALAILEGYHWPGNVKELKNIILRIISSTPEETIRVQDIPVFIQREIATSRDSQRYPLAKARKYPRQKTLKQSVVLCGQGLHSGIKGGLILLPAPPNSGIIFSHIPSGQNIPARLDLVDSTYNAVVLKKGPISIGTIEHLMAVLHAYEISNVLIKVGDEVPIMDGSAREFCQLIEEGGIEEQEGPEQGIIIDDFYAVGDPSQREYLTIEPYPGLAIRYIMDCPEPIGQQEFFYSHKWGEGFKNQIAPARTFVFLKDVEYLEEKGLTKGGRLSNVILLDEERVINTTLRFEDEYPRHKVLDIMGDLYLLGKRVQGLVTARMTGHTENIALLKKIRHLAVR